MNKTRTSEAVRPSNVSNKQPGRRKEAIYKAPSMVSKLIIGGFIMNEFKMYIGDGTKTITNNHSAMLRREKKVKQVVSARERFSCPWHGDCFKCSSSYECEQSEALAELKAYMD